MKYHLKIKVWLLRQAGINADTYINMDKSYKYNVKGKKQIIEWYITICIFQTKVYKIKA